MSPSGKAPGFDPGIRRFESCHPSHLGGSMRSGVVMGILYVSLVLVVFGYIIETRNNLEVETYELTD